MNPQNISRSLAGNLIITTSADPFTRGLDYLYGVRSLALEPDMIDGVHLANRTAICTWIGGYIDAINAQLNLHLRACHDCFQRSQQPSVQIFAAPIAQALGMAGLCNLKTQPITLLIDVGRVVAADWRFLVIHEYAHAQTGAPGHHQQFAQSLIHLCLGLGVAPPTQFALPTSLQSYPHCRLTQEPLAFWRGATETAF